MLKVGKKIVKYRIPILIISVLLLIPSIFGYVKTRVNYDILSYLPEDIETMQGQDILMDEFGKGAYALFMADGLTDTQAANLKDQMEEIDHVDSVLWYTSLSDVTIPPEMLPDEVYDFFHSDSGTLMAIFFDTTTSADVTMDAIEELRDLAGEQCFLSSMSAVVTDTRNLVNSELAIYVVIAVVLSCIVLALTMDSWMAPALFMISIGMAIIYNMGTNIFKGEISFITMALAAVLQLGVTMDYSIFLWNSYREAQGFYESDEDAMAHAISMTISSVTGSSLTTVAGFIALCFMTFTLGMDLGIVMAKGVILGVLCCIIILPSLILTFGKSIRKTQHKPLTLNCSKISKFIIKYRNVLAILLMLLWIPAIYGYQHTSVYYKLDSSLPSYLPSVQANEKLASDYDMGTVHLVLVDKDLSGKAGREMTDEMQQVDGVKSVIALDSVLPASIPKDFLPAEVTDQLTSENHQLMLISSSYAVASDEVNEQVEELNTILKKYDESGMLIGEAPCTKDLITITDRDFKIVSAVSIGAIFILILLVLHSISLPAILVLVIELAIYINMGISYYTGTTLPFIASVVIGTIQLGATVDYAILMTNRYLRERKGGMDKIQAATVALETSMPSIITSALGFFAATVGVGIYSDIDLVSSLCLLMARGALVSMGIVLFLLPALYILFDGLIFKTSWGLKERGPKSKA
jgi:hypothetical protein